MDISNTIDLTGTGGVNPISPGQYSNDSIGSTASATVSQNPAPSITDWLRDIGSSALTQTQKAAQDYIGAVLNPPPNSYISTNPPAETKIHGNQGSGPYQSNAPQGLAGESIASML